MEISIRYKRRSWQREMAAGLESRRWAVVVAHRRAGKTIEVIVRLMVKALECQRQDPRFAYIAPLLKQAKEIAWTYLKRFSTQIPGVKINESELWIEYPNQARVRLFGADNPDSMRGLYFDGVVMDEVAQMSPETWTEIIRPALSDRQGWAVFIGTPKGQNMFAELYHKALKQPEEWYAGFFPVDKTDVLPASELELARRDMGPNKFKQEYYCDFSAAAEDALITFDMVQAAATRKYGQDAYYKAAKILGVDCARFGDDKTVFIKRQGIVSYGLQRFSGIDTMQAAGKVAKIIDDWEPDVVFVDEIGIGAGVVDRLRQLGKGDVVIGINSATTAADDAKHYNLRAEMWVKMRDWLVDGGLIPDDPELRTDLLGPTYSFDNRNRVQLERKEDMKKRGLASPDCADALALTFAQPVATKTWRDAYSAVAVHDYDPYNQPGTSRAITDYDPLGGM